MNFLREIKNCLRFFWQTDPKVKRIVFYAEHEGYSACFEGLVRELTEVRRVPICYVTSDPDDPVLTQNRPRVHAFYLRSLLPWFMLLVKCRAFVMTLTDLHQFHLKRSMHGGHYVYVFHSMVSTHMMYRAGAFDHYDSILCVGPHHRAEIRAREEQQKLPARELVDAGYYRLERIHARASQSVREVVEETPAVTMLVAPSWGEHNLLKSCGPALVALLLKQGYRVIVRPHPETHRRDPALVASLVSTFGGQPRFAMEKSVASDASLLDADLLLCDLSGVALEYAFGAERPVLFFDVAPKVHNDDYRSLGLEPVELVLREQLGLLVSPDDLDKVPAMIDRLLNEREEYRRRLDRLRSEFVYHFGQSSQIGAAHIMRVAGSRSDGIADLAAERSGD